jgi:hypothetical protein
LLRVVAENVVTDRHTYEPSTVTLAAHARRGLTMCCPRCALLLCLHSLIHRLVAH